MDIAHIKKILEAYIHRDRSKLYISPYGVWIVVLAVSIGLFIGAGIFGYYVFVHYYLEGIPTSTAAATETQLSKVEGLKKDLDDVMDYFAKKEQLHADLLKEKKTFSSVLGDTTNGTSTNSTNTNDVVDSAQDSSSTFSDPTGQ